MTINAPNPSDVPNGTNAPLPPATTTSSSLPTPAANAPAPAPPATDTAVSDKSPSAFSLNIPPPPTGNASVSYSNWREVPTEPMSECQPEIAPHAIVTKSMGQSGNICCPTFTENPLKAALLKFATSAAMNGANTAPTEESPMVNSVIQKPM